MICVMPVSSGLAYHSFQYERNRIISDDLYERMCSALPEELLHVDLWTDSVSNADVEEEVLHRIGVINSAEN